MSDDAARASVSARGRFLQILTRAAVLAVLTLAVFLVLNLAAHLILMAMRSARTNLLRGEYFIPPNSPQGLELLREILQTEDTELIRSLAVEDPGIRPHPVLHFANGPSGRHYEVGLEGIRYEPGWTDGRVREWLLDGGRTDYVFGGSTTFGHGVPGQDTLVANMNRLNRDGRFLNLAVLAYESLREGDLLIHLLRQGYRPRRTVFVDGLNDWITFCESPFPAHDKPRMQALLMDRGQVPLIFGYPRRNNMRAAFAFAFPLVQLMHRMKSQSRGRETYGAGYSELKAMDWPAMMYFYENWDRIQLARARALAQEWVGYYREHVSFVKTLGTSFGFESIFVYQPIGLLETGHPFLKPAFMESPVLQIFQTFDETVREAIQARKLEMIDCSRAISGAGQVPLGYVDATHYSPAGNELLARCIQENLDP